jgi:hypothetical protein
MQLSALLGVFRAGHARVWTRNGGHYRALEKKGLLCSEPFGGNCVQFKLTPAGRERVRAALELAPPRAALLRTLARVDGAIAELDREEAP